MITGHCLCEGVAFEVDAVVGPFELCHCSRCRRVSGSAFVAGLGVRVADYRLVSGAELIQSYEAPILERPPAYRTAFCSRCGSPVPNPPEGAEWFEIPAGLLNDDPGHTPDRHIYVDYKSAWDEIADTLPQCTKAEVAAMRMKAKPRS